MVDLSKRHVHFERHETHPGTLPTPTRNHCFYYVQSKIKEKATMVAMAALLFSGMAQLLVQEVQNNRLVQVSLQQIRRNQSLHLVWIGLDDTSMAQLSNTR
jgi:hypothetical protein